MVGVMLGIARIPYEYEKGASSLQALPYTLNLP